MENWLFILFLSHLPGPLSFYTALENNTIFLQQFLGFGGGEASTLPPAGAPGLRVTLSTFPKPLPQLTLSQAPVFLALDNNPRPYIQIILS